MRRAVRVLALAVGPALGAAAAPAGAVTVDHYYAQCTSYGIHADTPVGGAAGPTVTGSADQPGTGSTTGCEPTSQPAELKLVTYQPSATAPGHWEEDAGSVRYGAYSYFDATLPLTASTVGLCVLGRPHDADAAGVIGYFTCWHVTTSRSMPPTYEFTPMTDPAVLPVPQPSPCRLDPSAKNCNPGGW